MEFLLSNSRYLFLVLLIFVCLFCFVFLAKNGERGVVILSPLLFTALFFPTYSIYEEYKIDKNIKIMKNLSITDQKEFIRSLSRREQKAILEYLESEKYEEEINSKLEKGVKL
ncbi:hypothetical protein MWG02_03625 [Fusobacterium necrophorum]|uniref:hypothetical protein n=1 Tax=Fusobacterium TaxID=848 RepID=UPI000786AF4E|nr:hypothetical protein [Fusobacterium necrophorum]KYM48177.1 hypothetical protein A2U04_05480 [Fusobacterium necrophorum subsp. funduliforme]MDK4494975.1 hypothetical protein [Fusobacterium necrophorum]